MLCSAMQVKGVTVATGEEPSGAKLAPLLSTLPIELRDSMEQFIQGAFAVGSGCALLRCPCCYLS